MVVFTDDMGISICKGCPNGITKQEQKYPHNMVFHRRGSVGYFNKKVNKYMTSECNVHMHLNKACLRRQDTTIEYKDIAMTNDMFDNLSKEQMQVLQESGILHYILQNKCEEYNM